MNYVTEIASAITLVTSIYVIVVSCDRLRQGQLKWEWATLYTVVLASTLWNLLGVTEGNTTLLSTQSVCAVAAYMFLTRKSWDQGVPSIAKKADYE